MTCLEALEYISRDIDGDLNEFEKEELQKHIESCSSCKKEYEEMKSIVDSMKNEEMLDLPSGFHDELMDKINESKVVPLKSVNKKPYYKKYTAIAAAIAVFAVVGITSGGFNLIGVGSSASGTASIERDIETNDNLADNSIEITEGESTEAAEEESKAVTDTAKAAIDVPETSSVTDAAAGNSGISNDAPVSSEVTAKNTEPDVTGKAATTSDVQSGAVVTGSEEQSGSTGSSQKTGDSVKMPQSEAPSDNSALVDGRSADTAEGNTGNNVAMPFMVMAEMPVTITVSAENKAAFTEAVKEYVSSVEDNVDESVENVLSVTVPKDNYEELKNIIKENSEIVSDEGEDGKAYSSVIIKFQ